MDSQTTAPPSQQSVSNVFYELLGKLGNRETPSQDLTEVQKISGLHQIAEQRVGGGIGEFRLDETDGSVNQKYLNTDWT